MAGSRGRRMIKKAPQSKGKRWSKGQSSSSNPTINKHRLAAKHRLGKAPDEPSQLTSQALTIHNEIVEGSSLPVSRAGSVADDDVESVGGKTVDTFASDWTDCSNPSFNRLTRNFHMDSALQKEMLAILAAVTEVIKSNSGKETDTEYFAALMTSLEAVDKPESLTACILLLGLVMKRLPPSVLKLKFGETSKVFIDLLSQYVEADNFMLLKGLIGGLSLLLRAQDSAVWHHSSTLNIYQTVLNFAIHSKPRLRKAAQHAVCSILKGSAIVTAADVPKCHPAAVATAKFCIHEIEAAGGSKGDSTTTLHLLVLLKDVLSTFPQQYTKTVCETLLRLLTLGNVLLTSNAMQALHGMFRSHPRTECLPAELNAQLVNALHDFQPSVNDAQPIIAWITTVQEALANLHKLDETLCLGHLPRFFQAAVQAWLSSRTEVQQIVTASLKALLYQVIQPMGDSLSSLPPTSAAAVEKVFTIIEGALRYAFHGAWKHVFHVLAVFFEVTGKHCTSYTAKSLQTLADMRESQHFTLTNELDYTVGIAVRYFGPRTVLQALPLRIGAPEGDDLEFPRSWLLPIIRDNVRDTELGFFASYFLPLAIACRAKAAHLSKEGRQSESSAYYLIQIQIWSLLPGFCTRPTDIVQSFRKLAKTLGTTLNDHPDVRLDVLSALRLLVNKNLDQPENRAELARFDKNFLPILFNLYTSEQTDETQPGVRLAVLETVKIYLMVANKQVINSLYEKASGKIDDADVQPFVRHAVMDLTMALLPYLDVDHISLFYKRALDSLEQTDDRAVLKKAYRMLEELCASSSDACQQFVTQFLPELQKVLLKSLSTSGPSTKAARLRCLCHVLKRLPKANKKFVVSVMPEAVLCLKEPSTKARESAFNLIIECGKALVSWSKDDDQGALRELVHLLMAGLAGSPVLVSATVAAMGKVFNTFKEGISEELLRAAVDNVSLLLLSSSREVVRSALEFVKGLVSSYKQWKSVEIVEVIMTSLMNISSDIQRPLRFKIKEVVAKLVKRFGLSDVSKFVPESHRKMFTNVRRTQQRQARKRIQKATPKNKHGADDEDEDDDDLPVFNKAQTIEELLRDSESEDESKDVESKSAGSRRTSAKKAWIHEGMEGKIINFLEPSASQSISATAPISGQVKKGDVNRGFKMSADGRLIVAEDDEEEKDSLKNKAKGQPSVGEIVEALTGSSKGNKRKRNDSDSEAEEEDKVPKYQAGGSGIHRPVGMATKKNQKIPGSEYRAQKAGGDIKRRGKPDPYAYIPLEKSMMSKRKKAKVSGLLSGLVKAARHGASRGKVAKQKGQKKMAKRQRI